MYPLGRLPRTHNPAVPFLRDVLAERAAPPLAYKNWASGMPANLGMMLNDRLGDCADAGFWHGGQVWTFNADGASAMFTQPDSLVEALYADQTGWNPASGGEGPGSNLQSLLTYLLKTGAPMAGGGRHKIAAFYEVDVGNWPEVVETIDECGFVYLGFNVPAFLMPADAPPLRVWSLRPGQNRQIIGGHAVIAPAADANGADIISWGSPDYRMGRGFWREFVDEAYAIVDPLWIAASGKSPWGLTIAETEAHMAALKAA